MNDLEAALRWYLVLSAVSIAFAPAIWWLGKGLGAGRQALIRPLGLVLATFVVWWPAALLGLPFNRLTIVAIIVISGILIWIMQFRYDALPKSELTTLALFEVFWLVLFSGYVWFRMHNPDIANTEKPMEIALLNSIVRTENVPAPDPWFAGSIINYYYLGFQQVATIVKFSGVPSSIAFNLSLATIFASVGVAAGAVAVRIAGLLSWRKIPTMALAILAAFFVSVAGNMETAKQFVRNPRETVDAGWWDGIGWNASRIIYDSGVNGNPEPVQTINEFPAFSFVLGDLHPHLLSYPLLIAIIALAVGLITTPATMERWRLVVIGVLVGVLYSTNSWDFPIGLAIVLVAVMFATWRQWQKLVVRSLYVVAGAVFAAFPFALEYTTPVGIESSAPDWVTRIPLIGTLVNTIAVVSWRPSSITELLTVHGLWIAIAVFFIAWGLYTNRILVEELRSKQELLFIAALIAASAALFWVPALILIGAPLAGSVFLTLKDDRLTVKVVATLFTFGLFLALIPEFLYIQDPFGNRMNTVFKLFFQAWAFLAIGSAVAFGVILSNTRTAFRFVSVSLLLVTVLLAVPYVPLSASDWMKMRSGPLTLDGAAYIEDIAPSESLAIAWLSHHAEVGDVVVESPGCGYQTVAGVPMNRASAFTGVETILGWSNHEGQWRRGESPSIYPRMAQRSEDANSWLDGAFPASNDYQEPRFIYFGAQETNGASNCPQLVVRDPNGRASLENAGWTVAFENGPTLILVRDSDPLARIGN